MLGRQAVPSNTYLELGSPPGARLRPLTSREEGRRAIGWSSGCSGAWRGGRSGKGKGRSPVLQGWAPGLAAEFGICLGSDFFFFFLIPKANGWRRSKTRLHSSALCLVLLSHPGTRDRRAVMCAEGGIGKAVERTPSAVPCLLFTLHLLLYVNSALSLPLVLPPPPNSCVQV